MNRNEKSVLAADELAVLLWPQGDRPDGPQVYAIVDAARDRRIIDMIRATGLEQSCLFSGVLSPALQAAAPYLVHLAPDVRFTRDLFELGWGESWFTLYVVSADVTLMQLRRHLRTLLRVRDEGDRKFMFRFYDPRVLRVYLPTCTPAELDLFFGKIQILISETGEADALIRYERDSIAPTAPVGDPAFATLSIIEQAAATQELDAC